MIFSRSPYRYRYRYRYFSNTSYRYRYQYFPKSPYRYRYRYRYFWNCLIDIDIDIDIFQNCLIDIDIDIFKNDHIDIDIDIDIFQKCRYIDNRYVISIYRTGLGVANIWLEHNIMCYSLKNKGILCPCNSLTLVLGVASQSTIQCLFDLQKEFFRLKGEVRTKWWAHNLQEHPLHKSS